MSISTPPPPRQACPGPRRIRFVGRLRDRAGFSLPETIVALALVGLVVGVGVPRLFGTRDQLSVRSAADRFAQTYALTRSTAARFGTIAELHIDRSGARFWIQVGRGSEAVDTLRMVDDLGRGVELVPGWTVLCFDARGLPTTAGACESPSGRIEFRSPTVSESLTITPLGKILR